MRTNLGTSSWICMESLKVIWIETWIVQKSNQSSKFCNSCGRFSLEHLYKYLSSHNFLCPKYSPKESEYLMPFFVTIAKCWRDFSHFFSFVPFVPRPHSGGRVFGVLNGSILAVKQCRRNVLGLLMYVYALSLNWVMWGRGWK